MFMHALYRLLRPRYRTVKVTYEESMLDAYLADSFVKKMFGLMFRDGLEENWGMLFVLGKESSMEASIWMLNMRFSIDTVWMDHDGTVVDVAEDMVPCASMFGCKTYVPKSKAKYVLELNAGSVRSLGLKIGDKVGLPGHGNGTHALSR